MSPREYNLLTTTLRSPATLKRPSVHFFTRASVHSRAMASDETPTTYLKDYEAYPYLVPRVRARPRPRTPPRPERRAPSRLAIASFQIHVSRPADPIFCAFAIGRDAAIPRLHAAARHSTPPHPPKTLQ